MRALAFVLLLGCASGPTCPAFQTTAIVIDDGASTAGAQSELTRSLGRVPAGALAWYWLYEEATLDEATSRVLAHYYDSGYASARIDEPAVELAPDRSTIGITLRVRPGPRFRLGTLRIVEESAASRRSDQALPFGVTPAAPLVREVPGLVSGAWFSRREAAGAVDAVTAAYGEQGYAEAEVHVRSEVRIDEQRIDLELTVARGDVIVIDAIEILDQEAGDLGRELLPVTGLSAGEQYRRSAVDAAVLALERARPGRRVRRSMRQTDGPHRILSLLLVRPEE